MRNGMNKLALAAVLLMLPGCDTLTGPETLGPFSWQEIEGDPVVESTDFVAIGNEVIVIGQFATPTACYRLSPHLTEGSSRLTLRIAANSTQTPNCAQRTGSFRYEARLHRLGSGTYEFIIVHDIEGVERREFPGSFTIGS